MLDARIEFFDFGVVGPPLKGLLFFKSCIPNYLLDYILS